MGCGKLRKMKKVTAVIEKSSEGLYSVYDSGLKQVALNGQGDSVEEAIQKWNHFCLTQTS
jgi:predicted RNase H-like HicB family nuclease